MGYLELALIGVGLSMDAFAVSVCKGLSMRKVDKKYMFVLAAFFGGFQALMPALGWLLGSQFQSYITAIDHWIAFIPVSYTHLDVYKRQPLIWSVTEKHAMSSGMAGRKWEKSQEPVVSYPA